MKRKQFSNCILEEQLVIPMNGGLGVCGFSRLYDSEKYQIKNKTQ